METTYRQGKLALKDLLELNTPGCAVLHLKINYLDRVNDYGDLYIVKVPLTIHAFWCAF